MADSTENTPINRDVAMELGYDLFVAARRKDVSSVVHDYLRLLARTIIMEGEHTARQAA